MARKYAIWDKETPIITPKGEVLTPEQWVERYPVAGLPSVTVVCGTGEINGAIFGTLGQLVETYEKQGCDFSSCETDEDKLSAIEAFDDAKEAAEAEALAEAKANEEVQAMSLASIAASLEYQNMMSLDDVEG